MVSSCLCFCIVHRNHFFHLYQQNKSSESKVKLRQASNRCKRVVGVPKIACASETKESFTNQKLSSQDCWYSKLNLLYLLYSATWRCSSASDKAKLVAKSFSKNSNLDDSGISLPVFPARTNLKLHNIPVTPNAVKMVIINLDSSKAFGPDCIPVVVLKNCEPELSCIEAV